MRRRRTSTGEVPCCYGATSPATLSLIKIEAEALVTSAADVLVNALEAEKVLREEARTECTKEHNDWSKMTAAELHELLRNVSDSVEKPWPPGAQSPIEPSAPSSHADADGDKDKQQRAREAETGPQDEQGTQGRIESLKMDAGSNKDFDDDSDGFTTSENEAMLSKDRSIKTNKSSELAMMTGEDFERHLFGTR